MRAPVDPGDDLSMPKTKAARIRADDITPGRARGGELRIVLGPGTVSSRSGYMGTVVLQPGERVVEHFHPYSEEFLFSVRGDQVLDIEGEEWVLGPGEGLYIPIGVRHRLRNVGTTEAFTVYHLGPLAPDPALSHVDTETLDAGPGEHQQPARILFSMRVAEGRTADFLAAYENIRYSVAGVPGHVRDQICRSPQDPDQWLITSEWESLDAFLTWEKSDEHRELVRPMRDCYTDPEFRSFSVVAETRAAHR